MAGTSDVGVDRLTEVVRGAQPTASALPLPAVQRHVHPGPA